MASDRYDEALADFVAMLPEPHGTAPPGEAASGDRLPEAHEQRAHALVQLDRTAEAIAALEAAAAAFPLCSSPLIALGNLLETIGDADAARR